MAVQTFIHDEGRTGAKHLPPQSPACGKVVGRPRLMPRKALLANTHLPGSRRPGSFFGCPYPYSRQHGRRLPAKAQLRSSSLSTTAARRVHRHSCSGHRRPFRGPGADPPGSPRTLRRLRQGYLRGGCSCATIMALQHMSDHFHKQIDFLGIESSPSFVRAPEGNGCSERFIRTLKENLLWVRYFATVEELRLALLEFKRVYTEK